MPCDGTPNLPPSQRLAPWIGLSDARKALALDLPPAMIVALFHASVRRKTRTPKTRGQNLGRNGLPCAGLLHRPTVRLASSLHFHAHRGVFPPSFERTPVGCAGHDVSTIPSKSFRSGSAFICLHDTGPVVPDQQIANDFSFSSRQCRQVVHSTFPPDRSARHSSTSSMSLRRT